MKITDPIADLLTRIRNAARARKSPVMVPHSNMKEAICKVLKDHKFIEDVRVTTEESGHKTLILEISKEMQAIEIQSVSTPGQRIYIKTGEIQKVMNGLGISILSTSKGVMSGAEARRLKLGGEFLCKVY